VWKKVDIEKEKMKMGRARLYVDIPTCEVSSTLISLESLMTSDEVWLRLHAAELTPVRVCSSADGGTT
jgi:hypothetical protein